MSIKTKWDADDSERNPILDRARECAALSKPWVLPEAGQSESEPLPQSFSSIVPRGTQNLAGKKLTALFPPGIPFVRYLPAGRFRYSKEVNPQQLQAYAAALALCEMIILSKLESSVLNAGEQARSGFRARQLAAIIQLIVTGDVLQQVTDNWRIRVFRRDQYVTRRNGEGDVIYHTIHEKVDPVQLDDATLAKLEIVRDECRAKPYADRCLDLYTDVEWQPQAKNWVIRQEINEKEVATREEKISPYFGTPYELPPDANYGVGFIEQNIGDARSANALRSNLLDFAGMASKMLTAIDYNSMVAPGDIAKPSGSVIQARVVGGIVQDVALLSLNKLNDFKVVYDTHESIKRDLAAAMLLESAVQPQEERVTALQVQRIAIELSGAIGPALVSVADGMQVPLSAYAFHLGQKQGLVPASISSDAFEIEAQTGIAALAREQEANRLMRFVQTVAPLGETAVQKLDLDIIFNELARLSMIFTPGVVKSDAKIAAEVEAQMARETEMAARGAIVEAASQKLAGNNQRGAQQPA